MDGTFYNKQTKITSDKYNEKILKKSVFLTNIINKELEFFDRNATRFACEFFVTEFHPIRKLLFGKNIINKHFGKNIINKHFSKTIKQVTSKCV